MFMTQVNTLCKNRRVSDLTPNCCTVQSICVSRLFRQFRTPFLSITGRVLSSTMVRVHHLWQNTLWEQQGQRFGPKLFRSAIHLCFKICQAIHFCFSNNGLSSVILMYRGSYSGKYPTICVKVDNHSSAFWKNSVFITNRCG